MLRTKVVPEEGAVEIYYDGFEFTLITYAVDVICVTCKRRGEWDYYEPKPYRTIAEACEAIFYGTILVNRTESGHFYYDKLGNITDLIPLTYYEIAA